MFSSGRRWLQWYRLSLEARQEVWKYYGIFTSLAFVGCFLGSVSAAIQLSDPDGVISLLFYFDDQRVLKDEFLEKRLDTINLASSSNLANILQKFAARVIFSCGEFFFFSIAKIYVAHRLIVFVKIRRSERAIKLVDQIDLFVFTAITALCSIAMVSSFVTAHYYAEAGRTVSNSGGSNLQDVVLKIADTLDKGNKATIVMHFAMCISIFIAFVAQLTAAALASRGIRKVFTVKKLEESPQSRKIRLQIIFFCTSVLVCYVLDFM
jgi:hypothetical protein